jgi:lipoate-protein ligase A
LSSPVTIPFVTSTPLRFITAGFASDPGLDIALSRALLLRASAGEIAETFRLNQPGRMVAFGKRDTIAPGYPAAVAAARSAGFEAVERLAGGRAAVFHEGTLAFSWTIPDQDPRRGIHERFRALAELLVGSFADLGVSTQIGEISGEYCPGEYSVNIGGTVKVMGVGQRLARTAAHIGGVIVVSGGSLVRAVLEPVYRELDLPWRPSTAGSLQDANPGITVPLVVAAVAARLAATRSVIQAPFEPATMALGRRLASEHISPSSAGAG